MMLARYLHRNIEKQEPEHRKGDDHAKGIRIRIGIRGFGLGNRNSRWG